jgi:ferric-dicitrate binding protein FerR (iron transport regulator)
LFTGEASPEEKRSIKDWLNLSSENQKLFNDLKEIWLSTGTTNNADKYHLESAIRQFRNKVTNHKKREARKIYILNIVKYAAVALLVLGLPFSYFMGQKNKVEIDTFTTVTCALGDKSMLVLPDSSIVNLNSGSKITFNNNFKKGERQVFLEGEAYFKVTKDKENPFHIKTKEIDIEVLGTEFNLKAYANEETVSTTLIEGSVKVTSQQQITTIKPAQKLVYSSSSKKMKLYELTDTSADTEWKDGRLVFRNETLKDLELKLERWFDVDIELADEAIKNRRYTGNLERESIIEVISYISLAQSVNYKLQ